MLCWNYRSLYTCIAHTIYVQWYIYICILFHMLCNMLLVWRYCWWHAAVSIVSILKYNIEISEPTFALAVITINTMCLMVRFFIYAVNSTSTLHSNSHYSDKHAVVTVTPNYSSWLLQHLQSVLHDCKTVSQHIYTTAVSSASDNRALAEVNLLQITP